MTQEEINVDLFNEVKDLQREIAGLKEALAIANRSADEQMRYKRRAEVDVVKANLELAACKSKLCEVISIARKGRYSAEDFVNVGMRLDAMDDYVSNPEVRHGANNE